MEKSYEAQAGFAADASHELRTPLAFIRAGVETLTQHDPSLGADVLSEVDYLTGLSQRLLQLARADRGQLQLDRTPIDLAATCRSAVHRSRVAHGNHLSDRAQLVQHFRIANVSGVNHQLRSLERLHSLRAQQSVGVGNHADHTSTACSTGPPS